MKILIIEDDELYIESFNLMLNNIENYNLLFINNFDDAKKVIISQSFDLYIIDIKLNNEFIGINLAEFIKEKFAPILFVSSYTIDDFYQKVMNFNNAFYLVKPFHEYTFESTIRMLIKNKAVLESKQYLKINSQTFIDFNLIIFIEVDNNYCTVHTIDKKHVIKVSLLHLLSNLPKDNFVQIHRNFVVNINHIESVDFFKNQLKTTNNKLLILSNRLKKNLKGLFN